MNIEKKLMFWIILLPIITILIGITGGVYIVNSADSLIKDKGSQFLEQREINLQKQKLKLIVNTTINAIKLLKLSNKKDLKSMIYQLYPPKNSSYVFIYKVYNLKGGNKFAKMYLNPNRPDLEGKLIPSDTKDIKGFPFRKKMLQLIRKQGYAFVYYYYKKPHTNEIVKKLSYFKYYKPLHFIVASGVYLDKIENLKTLYKNSVDTINRKIIINFMFVTLIVSLIIILITILIFQRIKKEFNKFRKTIQLNEKKLKYKLYIDELTKLKSRKYLLEDIENQKFSCLILIDIDNFRNINQFFGAEIGDKYLIEFAKLLKSFNHTIKDTIKLYRIGADEFVMGIINSNYDITHQLANQLLEFISKHKIIIENEIFDVDITIVFSTFPHPLKKALLTLTEAKETNRSLLCYKDIKNTEKQFFEIKQMLKTAIAKSQIKPFAQPIVNSKKQIIKYELLMRIVTKDKVIPPYFLEYAKKSKLYSIISKMMIKECFKFIQQTDILCSINIDMQDIEDEETVTLLQNYMQKVNKPVVFEILESESFKNYNKLKKFVKKFKKYNVLIAIDDFGSGYSSYSEILQLKPDYIKIDGSLIKDLKNSEEKYIVIESILFLTDLMKIQSVAEFVEDEETFERLKALGIDEFQGYYFAKPTPLNELKIS